MARITMLRDFDWRVPDAKSATTIALKSGETYTVKRQCADDAVAAGAALGSQNKPDRKADENGAEEHS